MKMLPVLLVLMSLLAPLRTDAQCKNTYDEHPATSLTISQVRDSLKIGSPILVRMILTNNSNHDISVGRDVRERDYQVEVRDANGDLAVDTKYGHARNGHADPNSFTPDELRSNVYCVNVKAGETSVFEVDVSKLYEIAKPGKYTVQLQKLDPVSVTIVKSNKITLDLIQ